jgi:hypothetical protein
MGEPVCPFNRSMGFGRFVKCGKPATDVPNIDGGTVLRCKGHAAHLKRQIERRAGWKAKWEAQSQAHADLSALTFRRGEVIVAARKLREYCDCGPCDWKDKLIESLDKLEKLETYLKERKGEA